MEFRQRNVPVTVWRRETDKSLCSRASLQRLVWLPRGDHVVATVLRLASSAEETATQHRLGHEWLCETKLLCVTSKSSTSTAQGENFRTSQTITSHGALQSKLAPKEQTCCTAGSPSIYPGRESYAAQVSMFRNLTEDT